MFDNYSFYPYAWYTTTALDGLGGQGLVYQNGIIMSSFVVSFAKFFNLSWETASRFTFYIPFIVLSFTSSIILVKNLFPKNRFWFITPIIFAVNTYVLMMSGGGQILTALSYSLTPFTLFTFIKLLESEKSDNLFRVLFLAILLCLQTILDLRIAFVTVIVLVAYFIISFSRKGLKYNFKKLPKLLVAFLIVGLSNFYWLFPLAFFGNDPIKQLGNDYSSTSIVKFLSFANIENAFGLLHPYWPDNVFGKVGFMKPEYLLLPLIAFSSLLFIRKSKDNFYVLFLALIALIGIFLAKGANDPFGNLYIWLFSHIPGFQLFRDSFKWYLLIALSYSLLIPYFLEEITNFLENKVKNKFIFPIVVLLSVLALLLLIRPAVLGHLSGTFKMRSVPLEYVQLNNFLTEDKTFHRTLWIPNTQLFGYYSTFSPQISSKDFLREYDQDKLLKKIDSRSSEMALNYSSVKYVIVPLDSEKEIYLTDRKYDDRKYQKVVKKLDLLPYLKKDKQFGKIVVYKTLNYKDHIWCDCAAKISYQFVNPTEYVVKVINWKDGDRLIFSENFDNKWIAEGKDFKVNSEKFADRFNSFDLPSGSYNITVNYSPQKYVDIGTRISVVTIIASLISLIYLIVKKIKKE